MARATYTMEELDTLIAAGFSPEFISRDLNTNPKAIATRLRRKGRREEATRFDKAHTRMLAEGKVSDSQT